MTIINEDHEKLKEEYEDDKRCETVSLIASGYEWNCPMCGRRNTEIEILDEVECPNCFKSFAVDICQHAWE